MGGSERLFPWTSKSHSGGPANPTNLHNPAYRLQAKALKTP
jgi:hypothetical protein